MGEYDVRAWLGYEIIMREFLGLKNMVLEAITCYEKQNESINNVRKKNILDLRNILDSIGDERLLYKCLCDFVLKIDVKRSWWLFGEVKTSRLRFLLQSVLDVYQEYFDINNLKKQCADLEQRLLTILQLHEKERVSWEHTLSSLQQQWQESQKNEILSYQSKCAALVAENAEIKSMILQIKGTRHDCQNNTIN